jgi:hypothetical protein
MRKRIVINLDAPQDGPPQRDRVRGGRRRLWPKVLAAVTVAVLIGVAAIAVVGFFWWRHYQSTPDYTLTLLVDAAQRDDVAQFQKLIDDQEIAKNMVAGVSQKAAGRYGFALNSTIQQRIDGLMPSLLPRMQQTIHDQVVQELKVLASKSEPRPFIFLAVTVPSFIKVTRDGDTAKATAALSDRTIELGMRRDANGWRVIEYKDDVVVQRVVDGVMKELPAIGSIDSSSPLLKKAVRSKRRR